MFDFLGDLISAAGRAIGGASGFPSQNFPLHPRQILKFFWPPAQDPEDNPAGPTVEQILQARRFAGIGDEPAVNKTFDDTGFPPTFPDSTFTGEVPTGTGIEHLGDTVDPGTATFEPDPLAAEADAGTAEEIETEENVAIPVFLLNLGGAILTGAAAGTGFEVAGQALGNLMGSGGTAGSGVSGTSTDVVAPATTPNIGAGDLQLQSTNGRPPTIAEIRGMILRSIGARHGRRSFSYNVARRIMRDLGESAGARCLGINDAEACFLLIHPPKRRGRQITPKQINRAMGAYKRVRALNKSVRKTLGPGCKL